MFVPVGTVGSGGCWRRQKGTLESGEEGLFSRRQEAAVGVAESMDAAAAVAELGFASFFC